MKINAIEISNSVQYSLDEDIGSGDITAHLIPAHAQATAYILAREQAIMCGIPWVNQTYQLIDPRVKLLWSVQEGDPIHADQQVLKLQGNARSLVTGERSALNWLQTLSGTASLAHQYVQRLIGTKTQLLDTRKTLPGLRYAQKYAVKCGGGHNHRFGLYDAFLIKENHILACGSITRAIKTARRLFPEKPVEIEVENHDELKQALSVHADIILLDNFNIEQIRTAVEMNRQQAKLEVSGHVTLDNLHRIAETGIDYISVGALTKHIRAIDYSMRIKQLN